jgi:hypothetical protein
MAVGFLLMQTACETGSTDAAVYNDLVLRLYANRLQARVGEPVQIRFTVINDGKESWVLESPDTPVMDIVVDVVGGPQLLAWSDQNPDKVAHRLEWKPGETKVIEWVWIPREEDIAVGYYHDVFIYGYVTSVSMGAQSAGVRVCASNFCRCVGPFCLP